MLESFEVHPDSFLIIGIAPAFPKRWAAIIFKIWSHTAIKSRLKSRTAVDYTPGQNAIHHKAYFSILRKLTSYRALEKSSNGSWILDYSHGKNDFPVLTIDVFDLCPYLVLLVFWTSFSLNKWVVHEDIAIGTNKIYISITNRINETMTKRESPKQTKLVDLSLLGLW